MVHGTQSLSCTAHPQNLHSLSSILIPRSHRVLGLPNGRFSTGFSMESLPECTRTIYKSRHAGYIYIIMACLTTQSVADTVQRGMVLWLLNHEMKLYGRSRPWCNWKYYSRICMGDRNATTNFSQNSPISGRIWTRDLSNTKEEYYSRLT